MSLASIRVKETKGKKNALPKLINILGDPYKRHWPVLKDHELAEFKQMLNLAVTESGLAQRAFVKSKNIRIGLESSLRAIKQNQTACVLISLSLKPHHLIGLIARNVETKDATVPVFAQPKLEELTEELFGVRSLILALPRQVREISIALDEWVTNRKRKQRPNECRERIIVTKRKVKQTNDVPTKIQKTGKASEENVSDKNEESGWAGDFISFGKEAQNVILFKDNEKDDEQKLTVALNTLSEQANQSSTISDKMDSNQALLPLSSDQSDLREVEPTPESDCDDFIASEYKSLSVLHIVPNPNKIKKKKRNKNKTKK